MLTSNDYKELAARCTELAGESSEPTVAEALRALASDYPARAAKMHFVYLEQGTRLQGMSIVGADNQSSRSRAEGGLRVGRAFIEIIVISSSVGRVMSRHGAARGEAGRGRT